MLSWTFRSFHAICLRLFLLSPPANKSLVSRRTELNNEKINDFQGKMKNAIDKTKICYSECFTHLSQSNCSNVIYVQLLSHENGQFFSSFSPSDTLVFAFYSILFIVTMEFNVFKNKKIEKWNGTCFHMPFIILKPQYHGDFMNVITDGEKWKIKLKLFYFFLSFFCASLCWSCKTECVRWWNETSGGALRFVKLFKMDFECTTRNVFTLKLIQIVFYMHVHT